MKRYIVWTFLMLIWLIGFSSISLAEEGKWTKRANMPTARWDFSASVVDGKIYAVGGGKGEPLPMVEEYDPVMDKWTKKTDMPIPKSGLSTSVVNGKIYAIGGTKAKGLLTMVEEYDPITDKWTKKADMPTVRAWLATSVVNGKIYAIGGQWHPGHILSTVEEYVPGLLRFGHRSEREACHIVGKNQRQVLIQLVLD